MKKNKKEKTHVINEETIYLIKNIPLFKMKGSTYINFFTNAIQEHTFVLPHSIDPQDIINRYESVRQQIRNGEKKSIEERCSELETENERLKEENSIYQKHFTKIEQPKIKPTI